MSFSLVNNIGSLNSELSLSSTSSQLNATIQRLSSGLRINHSGDDAAGLSVANKFRSDIAILNQGVRNANDGLSNLQIVDGGLNTISTLLDRASTLAAESASDTFTGDRNILQGEFSKVLGEITRQAQNIGLVQGGANNKALSVIIGGGSDSFAAANTNNGVQIDLSGAANQVDAAGLGLSGLNIGAAQGSVDPGVAITALGANENLTFTVANSAGALTTFNVALSSGSTGTQVVNAINSNASAQQYGITASLDSNGALKISSSGYFSVVSDTAASGDGTTTNIGTTAQVTSGAYGTATAGAAFTAITAGNSQALDFTFGNSSSIYRLNLSGAMTQAQAIAAINSDATLNAQGVYAVAGSTGIRFVSTQQNFSIVAEAPTASGKGFAPGAQTVTAGTGGGGAAGARAALDAIKTAVAALGKVQGAVGAGENRLQQAIDLANSQITNFQSAESQIRDADVSKEASNLSRLTVLQQAGVAALAQANQSNQALLSLLR